jgi:hypothetical protein
MERMENDNGMEKDNGSSLFVGRGSQSWRDCICVIQRTGPKDLEV